MQEVRVYNQAVYGVHNRVVGCALRPFAKTAHLQEITRPADVRFRGDQAAVGVLAHTVDVRDHYCVGRQADYRRMSSGEPSLLIE